MKKLRALIRRSVFWPCFQSCTFLIHAFFRSRLNRNLLGLKETNRLPPVFPPVMGETFLSNTYVKIIFDLPFLFCW